MQQRTTGLVVGLVSFVILTVALLASTIYFFVEAQRAGEKSANSVVEKDAEVSKRHRVEDAYGSLIGFVTGDPKQSADTDLKSVKEKIGVPENSPNLMVVLASFKSDTDKLTADNDSLKKQLASAQTDAASARKEAATAKAAAQAAADNVAATIGGYRASTEKFGTEVKQTVADITKAKDEIETRRRNEVAGLQDQIDKLSSTTADQSVRLNEMQTVMDSVRAKPQNAAELVDGRVIDVGGADGEVFISVGAKNRIQPGMLFDVYDDATSIQYDPESKNLIPGKARLQVLKVAETTSTARVIPEPSNGRMGSRRPVVKDDVIANPIYNPNQRYKFLVHGKFDIDNDGRATVAEADNVRAVIGRWGGEVIEGDALRGDLDMVVLGVQPISPPQLAANANDAAYTQFYESKKAYDAYQQLYQKALDSRLPVLNWNRLQVLTNEGR